MESTLRPSPKVKEVWVFFGGVKEAWFKESWPLFGDVSHGAHENVWHLRRFQLQLIVNQTAPSLTFLSFVTTYFNAYQYNQVKNKIHVKIYRLCRTMKTYTVCVGSISITVKPVCSQVQVRNVLMDSKTKQGWLRGWQVLGTSSCCKRSGKE